MKTLKITVFFVLFCALSHADIIQLKDGKVIEGNIVGETKNDIMVESKGKSNIISTKDIKNIEREDKLINNDRTIYEDGINMIEQAKEYKSKDKYFQAIDFFKKAHKKINKISDKTKYTRFKKEQLIEIENNLEKINKEMEEKNLAIYKEKVISKEELKEINGHIEKGEIWFQEKVWIKPEQLCKKCNNTGKTTCNNCKGSGEKNLKCTNCNKGYITCSKCNGKGQYTCPECNGKCKFLISCKQCGGQGRYTCNTCGGTGQRKQQCRACVGSGKVREYYGSVETRVICYNCNGSGSVFEPCTRCGAKGERICATCSGKGEYWETCSECGGQGIISCDREVPCPTCGGKHIFYFECKKCNGKGEMKCPDCEGLGFIQQKNSEEILGSKKQ